jgi:Uma2 family endonuclease
VAAVAIYPAQMTVQEFEVYPFPDGKVELVRGEPRVMPPAETPHGMVQMNLLRRLIPFVYERKLGYLFNDGHGYELLALPRTVRNPDMAFIRSSRIPPEGVTRGFFKGAPDLVVEVLSPSESASDLQEKIDDYFAAGTEEIWVIDPIRRRARIVSADAPTRSYRTDESLTGSAVLPGFQIAVAALFEGLAP